MRTAELTIRHTEILIAYDRHHWHVEDDQAIAEADLTEDERAAITREIWERVQDDAVEALNAN